MAGLIARVRAGDFTRDQKCCSGTQADSAGLLRMTLTFLGAARTVTGSSICSKSDGRRMLVDCGLFQGLKDLRERNWHPLPVRATDITPLS